MANEKSFECYSLIFLGRTREGHGVSSGCVSCGVDGLTIGQSHARQQTRSDQIIRNPIRRQTANPLGEDTTPDLGGPGLATIQYLEEDRCLIFCIELEV